MSEGVVGGGGGERGKRGVRGLGILLEHTVSAAYKVCHMWCITSPTGTADAGVPSAQCSQSDTHGTVSPVQAGQQLMRLGWKRGSLSGISRSLSLVLCVSLSLSTFLLEHVP